MSKELKALEIMHDIFETANNSLLELENTLVGMSEYIQEADYRYDLINVEKALKLARWDILEKALKRNEPMKVDPKTFTSHSWGDFYNCPKCGETVRIYDNYCLDCGQKLDWSDDEN